MSILVNVSNTLFICMIIYFIGFANVFIALISIIVLFYTFLLLIILFFPNNTDNKK
jgi:hypothetical protein